MANKEQALPLDPASSYGRSSSVIEDEAIPKELKLRPRRWIICCGCFVALFLVVAVIVIALLFTVLRIKPPTLKMNDVKVQELIIYSNGNISTTASEAKLEADISIKNPNIAPLKFSNSTIFLYYGDMVVGEGKSPPGIVKARKTLRMHVTAEIVSEKLLDVPDFTGHVSTTGALEMSSYIVFEAEVSVKNIYKRIMEVKLNCTMTYNISRQSIQDKHCW